MNAPCSEVFDQMAVLERFMMMDSMKMTRMGMVMACAVATLAVMAPGEASAADGIDARFETLEATTRRGQLRVNYAFAQRSWRRIERAGISPKLVLYALEGERLAYLYSYELRASRGSLTFPRSVTIERGRSYALAVSGFQEASFVDRTRRRGVDEELVIFRREGRQVVFEDPEIVITDTDEPVYDELDQGVDDVTVVVTDEDVGDVVVGDEQVVVVAPPPQSAAVRAQVVAACNDAVIGGGDDLSRCIQHARTFADAWAVSMVEACKQSTIGSRQLVECLEIGSAFVFSPVPSLRACERHAVGGTNTLACLSRAAAYTYDPSRVIGACSEAVVGSTNLMRCVEQGAGQPDGYDAIVRACAGSMSSFQTCIEASTR